MFKKIILSLLLLAIVSGVALYSYSYAESKRIALIPSVLDQNKEVVKQYEFEDGEYLVDVDASNLNWQASKVLVPGYTDRGAVSISEGFVMVEDNNVSSSEFVIDMSTIAAESTGRGSGEAGLSKHLMSGDFFDVEKYPTAEFKLSKFVPQLNAGMFEVSGTLKVKDIEKPIVFLAEVFVAEDESLRAIAEIELDRTEWDIKYNSSKFFSDLGDKVIDDKFMVELDLVVKK
jgi:polyisoprenoid-binding protein YceI